MMMSLSYEKIKRKPQPENRRNRQQQPPPRQRQPRQGEVAGNADGRTGMCSIRQTGCGYHAAVPLLVEGAGFDIGGE